MNENEAPAKRRTRIDAPLFMLPPIAVPITEAAKMMRISVRTFRRAFLETGRINTVPIQPKTVRIEVAELRRAFRKLRDETRAAKE